MFMSDTVRDVDVHLGRNLCGPEKFRPGGVRGDASVSSCCRLTCPPGGSSLIVTDTNTCLLSLEEERVERQRVAAGADVTGEQAPRVHFPWDLSCRHGVCLHCSLINWLL